MSFKDYQYLNSSLNIFGISFSNESSSMQVSTSVSLTDSKIRQQARSFKRDFSNLKESTGKYSSTSRPIYGKFYSHIKENENDENLAPINNQHPDDAHVKVFPKKGRLLTVQDIGLNILRIYPFFDFDTKMYDWSYIPNFSYSYEKFSVLLKEVKDDENTLVIQVHATEALYTEKNDSNWLTVGEFNLLIKEFHKEDI